MRAAVFQRPGAALVVEDVPDPRPAADELLIAVRCCGICGSDLHMADAHGPDSGMPPLPAGSIMGHEFCGEVIEAGAADSPFRPGDRVTALPFISCGHCRECLSGASYRCRSMRSLGLGGTAGAYAEYAVVGPHDTLRLPDGVDFERGALVEPLAVALHAVHAARLAPGENVLVMGAGPIGLATALWCRHFGARHVVVSDRVDARLRLAEKLGASATVNASDEDVAGAFKRHAGRRPDVVIECIGIPGALQLAMDYAPTGGRIVVVGVCMAPDTISPVKALTKELQVNYVFCYQRQDFELTVDLLDREIIDPSPMLTGRVGFDDFPAAFEALKHDKTACKVLLVPTA
ncbi:MAG: zinc-dependent alcohol dehydrogenase [Gammaproteobacteria bacterium]